MKTTAQKVDFSMPDSPAAIAARQFPVAVLVEYQAIHDNRWIDGCWAVTGEPFADNGIHSKLIHSNEEG